MGEKLWFGTSGTPYNRNNTRYYNVSDYSWASGIEQEWPTLKEEISKFIKEQDSLFISNENTYAGLANVKGWHSMSSLFWGLKTQDTFAKNCPKTYAALKKIPGIISISFSKLEPQSKISKHHGETNAIMRCHLGIEVPDGLPNCGISVDSEDKGWIEGKWLFFNDAQEHYAWNLTEKRRILIIIDIIRPEFVHLKNLICARSLTEYFLGKRENIYPFLQKLPIGIKRLFIYTGTGIVLLLRPFLNSFR